MKDPKNLPVKTLMDSHEYRDFKEACVIKKIEHSRILRRLAIEWARQVKSSELANQKKEFGMSMSWSLPNPHSRVNYGTTPVRLRV